jgi:integral membrane protein
LCRGQDADSKAGVITTALGRFRLIGLLEGASFLALLCIAMPLKYLAGCPLAVKAVGWAHGVLFLAYLAALLSVWSTERWSVKVAALAVIAALLPAGPFVFDAWLRRTAAAALMRASTASSRPVVGADTPSR